jgi:hypothetical protein
MKHIDEYYKEWCGEHHTVNSCHPVHDSAEACDFAEYYHKEKSEPIKTMQQFFKNQIEGVASMTKKERNILLCQLSVKEHLNTIEPHEIIQLATIQAIRQANGEIDAVLKNWEENPDSDPRR